jgi:predicted RNA-binding Zn-ribbon protein involved in translation (DUF1610 family)
MSSSMIRCPNCGSVSVQVVRPGEYRCSSCGVNFHFIRPDVQRHDVVSHNCPKCGKPVQAGQGFKCISCGQYDLCGDCVDQVPNRGYMCKDCIEKSGEGCSICKKFAWHVCGSCKARHERGEIPREDVMQTCEKCFDSLFTTFVDLKRGRQLIGAEKVSFRCPRCGEICFDCAVEKKGFLSKGFFCKNCGSKVDLNVVWSPLWDTEVDVQP